MVFHFLLLGWEMKVLLFCLWLMWMIMDYVCITCVAEMLKFKGICKQMKKVFNLSDVEIQMAGVCVMTNINLMTYEISAPLFSSVILNFWDKFNMHILLRRIATMK